MAVSFPDIIEGTEVTNTAPTLTAVATLDRFFRSCFLHQLGHLVLDLIQSKTKTYLSNALPGMVSQMIYITEWSKP